MHRVLFLVVAAAAVLALVSPHRWPFAAGTVLVALVVWVIGRALAGYAPPITGAAACAALVFVALVPVLCSGSDNSARRSCTGLLPISLPGYSGRGADFEPSILPALGLSAIAGAACYAAARPARGTRSAL